MDELTRTLLYKDYCPFEAAGKQYKVFPMCAGKVADREFKNTLVRPNFDDDNPGNGVLLIMLDERLQADANRMLQEYCTHGDKPMSLEAVVDHGWKLPDFGRFLNLVAKLSGLVLSKNASSEEAADMDAGFLSMITFMQKHGGMNREEVLVAPLLRLYALQDGLLKHVTNELQISAMGGLGTLFGGGAAQTTNYAAMQGVGEYEELKFRIPSTGEMKTPDEMTPEEHREWVNSIG